MKPSTAKTWAIFFLVISGLALLFFGVNFIYGMSIGISLFSSSTAGILALIACIVFWLSMYANAIFNRSSMVLFSCAIVSARGVERWIRRQTRIWKSDVPLGQFIVHRINYSQSVRIEIKIHCDILQFKLEIGADFRSDSVLNQFAPYIIGAEDINRSIREKVEAIVFDVLTKEGYKKYEHYNNAAAANQQAAFDYQVKHDLQNPLNLVGLNLKKASFAIL